MGSAELVVSWVEVLGTPCIAGVQCGGSPVGSTLTPGSWCQNWFELYVTQLESAGCAWKNHPTIPLTSELCRSGEGL